jgi:uncharacterized protein with GYD domain
MASYLYQCSYTAESLAAQIKDPQDRLAVVNKQIETTGAKIVGGGYGFGDYDIVALVEAPNDTVMAAVAIAIGAGGGIRNGKTTKLLSGTEWVAAVKAAASVGYRPAR